MANNETIFNLPELTDNEVTYSNLTDVNNSAYTDGMFVYFSNLLKHTVWVCTWCIILWKLSWYQT